MWPTILDLEEDLPSSQHPEFLAGRLFDRGGILTEPPGALPERGVVLMNRGQSGAVTFVLRACAHPGEVACLAEHRIHEDEGGEDGKTTRQPRPRPSPEEAL